VVACDGQVLRLYDVVSGQPFGKSLSG